MPKGGLQEAAPVALNRSMQDYMEQGHEYTKRDEIHTSRDVCVYVFFFFRPNFNCENSQLLQHHNCLISAFVTFVLKHVNKN